MSQEITQGQKSEKASITFFDFLRAKPLEVSAFLTSMIGILAYAIGMSYQEGWNEIAGLPATYFQTGVNEAIRKGLGLYVPWLSFIGLFAFGIAYAFFINASEAWRNARRKNRKRLALAMAAKNERAALGIRMARSSSANLVWKNLGRRGLMLDPPIHLARAGYLRKRGFRRNILSIMMVVFAFLVLVGIYLILNFLALNAAFKQGRRDYVGVYVAVTGRLPPVYSKLEVTQQELIKVGCSGFEELTSFRVVTINRDKEGKGEAAYVLQAVSNTFLFLTKDGTVLKTFGGDGFELDERTDRPVADLMKSCPAA